MIDHHDHDDHYFHRDAPYIEPDYYATNANRNMPILSTVARGPRGYGVNAEVIEQDDGTFIYRLYNDETGETIFQSPNLSAGKITIHQDTHTPVAGEVAHAIVSVEQAGMTRSYDIYLPPGADGSAIYTAKGSTLRDKTDVYTWPIDDLLYDGQSAWPSKPKPRPNDVIIFYATDKANAYIAIGQIRAVEANKVTATVQTYVPTPAYYIGENGNWWIGEEDSGVHAQGPKGDKGTYSEPSIEEVGSYDPIEIVDLDSDPTNAQLHFKIPMAKMILIQAELASEADLPSFEDTPVGHAYLVNHPDDLRYDLYYRGPNPQPDTDWIIVKDWQGVPAKVITGETFHLPWGEDARVEGTPESGNEVKFDFYIPDITPDDLITGESPIVVTEEDSKFTIGFVGNFITVSSWDQSLLISDYGDHYEVGHEPSTLSPGLQVPQENYQEPAFGDEFSIPQITMGHSGHLALAQVVRVVIPETLVTQTDPGLMSPEDKLRLDNLDGPVPKADGVTITDNAGIWSAVQQDVSVPTIPVSWIEENFVL